MRRMIWCALGLGLWACDSGGGGSAADPDGQVPADVGAMGDAASEVDMGWVEDAAPTPDVGLVEGVLEIEPARVRLRVGDGPPPTQQFTLRRSFADREAVEIDPATAEWRVASPTLGEVEAGLFTSSGRAGEGTIYATHAGDEVVAALTVEAFEDIIVDGAPADAPDRFTGVPEGEGCGPRVLYPEPLTALPRNIQGLTLQWDRGAAELFAVVFRADGLQVRWFTDRGQVTPDGESWTALLAAATGGVLQFEVQALGGGRVCRSRAIDLIIDPAPLQGAVYYWSTGDAGIMRLPAGDLVAERFLTPVVAPEINCPACHALSRDGSRIAFTRTTFPPFGELAVSAVDTPRQLAYDPAGVVGYFPSFAPDNERVVAGAGGALVIRSVFDGAELDRLPMPMGFVSNSPDWSWQGTRIVAPISNGIEPIPDVGINQGSIAVWQLQEDDTWGPAEILVPQEDALANDRPAFSPDGRFIAFERKGSDPDESMGNASSRLMIVDESGAAVPLARANKAPGLGNAWPKWSPASNQGRLWLAFSSFRDYGHVLVNAGREEPRPQIWVTGIRPDAEPGTDPSSPGFWLPGQSIDSGNHIPYWAAFEKD